MISKSEMGRVQHLVTAILKMQTHAHGPMQEMTTSTGSLAEEARPASSQGHVLITQQGLVLVCKFLFYCLQFTVSSLQFLCYCLQTQLFISPSCGEMMHSRTILPGRTRFKSVTVQFFPLNSYSMLYHGPYLHYASCFLPLKALRLYSIFLFSYLYS